MRRQVDRVAMLMAILGGLVPFCLVAFAMIIAGLAGITLLNSWAAAVATMFTETWGVLTYVELTVIPLFVFMGNIASASGMSRDLYNTAYAWIGHFRGGLGIASGSDLIIWFGVVMVIVLEMALISPPVGMNVFVVKSINRSLEA